MTGENAAPAEMPGVEEIARLVDDYAFKSWRQAHDYEMKTTGDVEEAVKFADWSAGKRVSEARDKARAILALFAPILAEKERAELALCDLMNAAGHYKATHSEIDREALSATIKAAADHFAAAIRAEGE